MSFQKKAQSIPAISDCLRPGLKALGAYSQKITPSEPRNCSGSIDLDTCLKTAYPNEARWDYAIGYEGRAYFVEVHPASGQVGDVIAKVIWLKKWLHGEGAPLAAIHHPGKTFHWIPTNKVKIIGKYAPQLALNKITIISHLILP